MGMGYIKASVMAMAGTGATIAVFLGLLRVKLPLLAPAQRYIVSRIDAFIDGYQEPNTSWADQFNGAFYPASEVDQVDLTVVKGKVPIDLSGAYMRVGPNVAHWPPKKRTHVFDGDGFVHTVRIQGGKAVYHGQYIETPRYKFEQQEGEWFMRIGELHGLPGLAKIFLTVPMRQAQSGMTNKQTSTANTALGITPEGHVWALNEAGPPFRLQIQKNGKFKSVGYDDLSGTMLDMVSAHPKYDYRTGETFYHGKDLTSGQFYVGRTQDGKLQEKANLPVGMGFQHDMFITTDYVVVIDGSVRFDPKGMPKKLPIWNFDPDRKLRFGVYDRNLNNMTADNFVWIEAPYAAEIVHTVFGSNEGDKITLWAPVGYYQEGQVDGILGGVGPLKMKEVTIDVGAKSVTTVKVQGGEEFNTEFGRVRDDRVAQKTRYGFSSLQVGHGFDFRGIIKWDFDEKKRAAIIHFPEGVVGGEPVFIPSSGTSGDDGGYVSMFLWNQKTKKSSFALFDAKTFSSEPIVELSVPRKVPLGFHGWWFSENDIDKNLAAK